MVHLCFGAASGLYLFVNGFYRGFNLPPTGSRQNQGLGPCNFPRVGGWVKEILLWSTGFLEKWVQVLGSLPSLVIYLFT